MRVAVISILQLLSLLLLSVTFSQTSDLRDQLSKGPDGSLLLLNVSVTDKTGDFVAGLSKESFQVMDEKTKQEIAYFDSSDVECSVGLIIDLSGSMSSRTRRYRNAKEIIKVALPPLFSRGNPANEYFAMAFSNQALLLSDWTNDASGILTNMENLKVTGGSAVYDACYAGVQKVLEGKNRKRVIVLFSDGADNKSKRSDRELKELVRSSDVLVYTIGLFFEDFAVNDFLMLGRVFLRELASLSGGSYFEGDSKRVSSALEYISQELRSQYSIGIKMPAASGRRRWHRIRVEVVARPPGRHGIVVRTRPGYYAN